MNEKKNTTKEISERFFEIEKELNLFKQKIDGVYFWERIRFKIHRKILISTGLINEPHAKTPRTFLSKFKFIYSVFLTFFLKNPMFSKKTKMVFFGHPRRKFLEDEMWWDLYCDPITEKMNEEDYIHIENPSFFPFGKKIKTKKLRYLCFLNFILSFKLKFASKIFFTEEEKQFINKLESRINTEFGVNIDLNCIIKKILIRRKIEIKLYKKLLKRLNPKIVILVVSYGKDIITEVCKKLKIPTIELQHGAGVINNYHFGYSFPKEKRNFPDYLFVFGDFWKENAICPIRKNKISSVGYPFFEMEAKKYEYNEKRKQIVFVSQGAIGHKLSKLAVDLSNYNDLSYKILYKLHPGEKKDWRERYPDLNKADKEGKIFVIEGDDPPLYKIFSQSKIQVGVYSTGIYEGLYFGLLTFLLNTSGIENMEKLIKENHAYKINSASELIQKMKEAKKEKEINKDLFFKQNSLENIHREIDFIIKKENVQPNNT